MVGQGIALKGRAITKGVVEGEAVVTKEPFMFPHGLDPKTGIVINRRHELWKQDIHDKVLLFPFAVGSTSTASWLLEAIRLNKSPKALVLEDIDPMLAVGAILAELFYRAKFPVIDFPDAAGTEGSPLQVFSTGDVLIVDGNSGIVRKKV